ncbi:MAG TPA: four helix bundle protein [Terriglobales bacterium]|nr:four helix bundle protein [Terriglobales bacterium]
MKNFRNLQVWQKAHALTFNSCKMTARFPREELYGLTTQIRRCSASIAANIAEGCGRRGNSEFHRFLQIASGSASELEYHFLLAHDLGLSMAVDYSGLNKAVTGLKRMLSSLSRKVDQARAENQRTPFHG